MKKPAIPPANFDKSDIELLIGKLAKFAKPHVQEEFEILPTYKGEYLHWDELRCKLPRPGELTAEEWWLGTKLARQYLHFEKLPFVDVNQQSFRFIIPNNLLPKLAKIDRKIGGPTHSFDAYDQDRYLVRSLIEEAISSSQLEGASTTRRIAKEMLLSQRKPRTESERMIFNNYTAMRFIRENINRALSIEFILEIHRVLTENILEDAGQMREKDDVEVVDNSTNEVLHIPPKAIELEKRLKILCDFANTDESEEKHYIHPVIKAIILHFALAYDHPFTDGNGRTARALFYWFMLNRGYWPIEYISISQIIKQAPGQYGRAFLYTETDANDVTYFIFHQLKVILKAIDELYFYIEKQVQEVRKVEQLLHHNQILNHRQLAVIQHALKHPNTHYLIDKHAQSHFIAYQTARTDLLKLSELGLLSKQQIGRAFVFLVPVDFKKRIEKL